MKRARISHVVTIDLESHKIERFVPNAEGHVQRNATGDDILRESLNGMGYMLVTGAGTFIPI